MSDAANVLRALKDAIEKKPCELCKQDFVAPKSDEKTPYHVRLRFRYCKPCRDKLYGAL